MLEQFEVDLRVAGEKKAKWRLRWSVIRFFRPGIVLRNRLSNQLTHTGMLKNYLVVAYRNIVRNPTHTSLNVIGLALGLASCFLIGLYVRHELSFDSFHSKKEHIYRYVPQYTKDGQMTLQVQTAPGIAPYLQATLPEIEQVVRYQEWDNMPFVTWNEKEMPQSTLAMADSNFFQMFSFRLLQGNAATVLSKPLSVVVSKSIAAAVFGDQDPVGQVIMYENELPLEVTGVFEDVPSTSHLQFSYLLSMAYHPKLYLDGPGMLTNMNSWSYSTYLYAPSVADREVLEKKVREAVATKMKESGFGEDAGNLWLQPLATIHFTRGIRGDGPTSDISYVYIFSAIAVFIILIACFNFMNLSTARGIKRAREVGIRKVMGAFRSQLIVQFLSEAFIIVSLAGVISLVLFWLAIPYFNRSMDMNLQFDWVQDAGFLLMLLAVIIITAIAAGSYPAFYLSGFAPARTLKGGYTGSGKAGLRNILTVIQFSLAVFLIVGTLVIHRQTRFMKEARLGFDKESVLHFYLPGEMRGPKFETLRNNLLKHPAILNVSKSSDVPGNVTGHFIYEIKAGDEMKTEAFTTIAADYSFVETLGLEIAEGRNFSTDFASDTNQGYIVNETFVRFMGLDRQPGGRQPGGPIGTPMRLMNTAYPEGKIIGVVKDFHARSLQSKIEPMVMWLSNGGWEHLGVIRLNGSNVTGAVAALEAEWRPLASGYPLSYQFLDDTIGQMYRTEEKTTTLVGSFSVLAIIISCLGLTGLVSYMAEERKKEIGIRKVLGATMGGIISKFSWPFVRLILVAVAVTLPVAILAIEEWLANFAYVTRLEWWVFVIPVVAVLFITVAVSSGFTIRAAKANPVDCLRHE